MSDMPSAPAPMEGPSSNAKLIALLCWLFAPWGIVALFLDDYKNDRFIRAHAIQGAAVFLVGMILSAVTFGIGWFVVFIYQIYGAIQGFNGKSIEVPVIYGMVKNYIDQA